MSSIDKINVGGVDFDITSSPTPVMAPVETGATATQPYVVGDYVIVGSTLHEVTAAIAIGDTFTEGTNISTSTSLGDEIKEVKTDVNQLNNDLTELSNPSYTLLYTITSGNLNRDFSINWTDFSKILVLVKYHYSNSSDKCIATKELSKNELKIVANTPVPSNFIYPRISCFNYSDTPCKLQVLLGVANAKATTFRFQVDSSTYGFDSIEVYSIN